MPKASNTKQRIYTIFHDWLASCTRGGKLSRNTIAIGIVVLDHLRRTSPISREEIISQGGEIKGARSGLGKVLEAYGIPSAYLREVTTRQGHQDGQRLLEQFEWGKTLLRLSNAERDEILLELIQELQVEAANWLNRQNLKLEIDRSDSPATWVHMIIESAKQHSGGVVEQHLVGAKLERRYKGIDISNYPAHAGDVQTARAGDFTTRLAVYHVTAVPSRNVIQRCVANIRAGRKPILLVPREQENKARALAEDEGIGTELTILSIEAYVCVNIIELAEVENKDFFGVLQEIVQIYNRRLSAVETDLSLQIEIK